MSERVALITGSTSGIGAATARRLAREGYIVALHSRRSADVGNAMAKELSGASYHQADLADVERAGELVKQVVARHGRLDVLVNNAGEAARFPHADLRAGTPAVVGMIAVGDMVELLDEVGMVAVREKSVGLTEHAIALADEVLAPLGVEVASPRASSERGGHVTLVHPAMREVVAALWKQDVIPDYRDPGGLRVGLSPLSTSYDEVDRGIAAVRELLA